MRTPVTIEPAEWMPGERISIETATALVGAVRLKTAKLCGAKPAELGKLVAEIDMAMIRIKTFLNDVKDSRTSQPPHPVTGGMLVPITTGEGLEIEAQEIAADYERQRGYWDEVEAGRYIYE